MKLRRLHVRRMPGIDEPFVLDRLGDGLILVLGENGAGKSTLCRALSALLWPALERDEAISVEATFEDGPRLWFVRRDGPRTQWQCEGADSPPPLYPGEASARCFTLRFGDLLAPGGRTDETVAREIRRQLAGGYDLHEVARSEFALAPRHGRTEDTRLRERLREVQRIQASHAELGRREDEQRTLERRLDEAKAAAARLPLLRAAAARALDRSRLQAVQHEIAGLPQGLERLQGNELERLGALEAERARLASDLSTCRGEAGSAAARIEALSPRPLDEGDLVKWSTRARELRRIASDLRAAEEREGRARTRRDEAAAALDPERQSGTRPRIDAGSLSEIDLFLSRAAALRRESERVAVELAALPLGGAELSSQDLARALDALNRILHSTAGAGERTLRSGVRVLALCLIGGAALSAWLGESGAGWALGCAGAVLAALAALPGRARVGRREAERELARSGVELPPDLAPDVVRARLAELQDRFARAAVAEQAAERRAELERLERMLAEQEDILAGERQALRERTGIDPGAGDIPRAQLFRRVELLRQAELDLEQALDARSVLEGEYAALLERISGFLVHSGLSAAQDPAAAEAGLDELTRRAREIEAVGEVVARETARAERLENLLADNRRRTCSLWEAAGLAQGDDAGLARRLELREHQRELLAESRALLRAVHEAEAELTAADPGLGSWSPEHLAEAIAEAEAIGAAQTALAREIGALEAEVGQARRGQALESALGQAEAAREALERRRDEALRAAAGRFLLDEVASEFDLRSRPRLLARAKELFARFTHHRYELHVTDSASPEFRAVEVETGAGRALAELSDATRVQLLLAARLAYVEQVDGEAALPLVLDEVLATSDPERFDAVAAALIPVTAEHGRQMLYLTADPADLGRFERVLAALGLGPASVFDLGELRGLGLRAGGRRALEVPPLPEVPAPGTLAAEDYGELLGVPGVDPRRPVRALHLFHLLRDALPLLYVLLRERIATVGQWGLLEASGAAARLVGPAEAARVSALADLADELFRAWRIGRGRPVDSAVLRRAGIAETWVARLAPLIDELSGDAAKLLERLERREDERTRGFRAPLREKLREHLLAEGYLDEREPLDEPALHARVRSAVAHHVDAGLLRAPVVSDRVHQLLHQGRVHTERRGD